MRRWILLYLIIQFGLKTLIQVNHLQKRQLLF